MSTLLAPVGINFTKREDKTIAIQELKPRNLGGIISETFKVYGRNFLAVVVIVGIVMLVLNILGTLLTKIESIGLLIVVATMLGVGYITAYPLMGGALIHAVSEQSLGKPISIGKAYRFAWRRLGALIGAMILVTLAVFSMAITIIGIPAAIYFGTTWAFVWQTALLEGCGARMALSRSSALVKQNWWRVLGIMTVLAIIIALINKAFGLIPVAGGIIGIILLTPVAIIGSTLLYYDLRLRKEGYALEVIAEELGTTLKEGV